MTTEHLLLLPMWERLKDHSRSVFEKDDGHMPLFMIHLPGQGISLFPPAISNMSKQEVSQMLISLARDKGMREYAFVSEMWLAEGDKALAHKRSGESLETLPGRKEGLLLLYCNSNYERLAVAIITRDKDGKPSLGDWEEDTQICRSVTLPFARFNGIWQQAAVGSN